MPARNYSGSSDIIVALRQRVSQAIDATAGANEQRRRAWRQFELAPNGTEESGRSVIQSADVNSMITATLAQCVVAFSNDTVVNFEANSAEDEAQAKMESRAVNKILIETNGGFRRFLDATQNALLYEVGYVKVYWDDDIDQYVNSFENVAPDEVSIVVDTQGEPGVEKRLISYDPETRKARVDTVRKTRALRLAVVDNSQFFIDPDWTETDLQGCPLCGEVHYKTRDELSRMGIDWEIVKSLKAVQKYGDQPKLNRRRNDPYNAVDPVQFQMDICEVFEVYAKITFNDQDDRTYLHRCWLADKSDATDGWLLDPEPVDRVPYGAGTAFPIANRHAGEALATKLYSIQESKTEFLRQWFDNAQVNSIGRVGAVVGQVELSDVMTPRAGSPIRVKSPNAIVPIPVNDVGPSIASALAYLDQARTERGGASIDFLGGEMQLAQDTAHGTERVYSAKEMLVAYEIRNLAETMIAAAYKLAHAELRLGKNGPIQVKIAEQWQAVDPASWPARNHVNVRAGYSMGERMQISQAMLMMLQFYQAGMQQGLQGQLFTLPGLYKLLCDYGSVALIPNPESYFIDPESPQAQQAAQAAAQAAQKQAEQQAQILALPEQIKAQASQYKTDADTMTTMFKTVFEGTLQHEEAEIQGAVDVARSASEAKAQAAANGGGDQNAGAGNNRSGTGRRGGKSGPNGSARAAGSGTN